MTTGEYGGIGSLIHKQGDFIYISEPYENSPAHKAGLKAGDKIIKINDKNASAKSVEDVSAILKGQPGTSFKLVVEREGEPKPLTIEIVREKITIDPVPYYGMLGNGKVGYIKLNSFTQTASAEVKISRFFEISKSGEVCALRSDVAVNARNTDIITITLSVWIILFFINSGF